jgi:hypothetical protein
MNESALERHRQAEIRKTIRCGLIWLAIVAFAFAASVVLSGCQSYQPPGEGIWRAL